MSCITTVHTITCPRPIVQQCCRIDDSIWIVVLIDGGEFNMFIFDMNTKKYREVLFNNKKVIEGRNWRVENEEDFLITSANDKIYMLRKYCRFYRLSEFDPMTTSWSLLKDIYDERYYLVENFLIMDQHMYTRRFLGTSIDIMCLDTFDIKTCPLPTESEETIICEMNGLIYAVVVENNGMRNVYQYDKQRNMFETVIVKNGEPMEYLKHEEDMDDQWFLYTKNNKIYHVVHLLNNSDIIIDCFDMETGEWITLEKNTTINLYITDTFEKGNKLYFMIEANNVQVHVMDLKPSLETLSMIKVADMMVANGIDQTDSVPIGIRDQLRNMVEWKKRPAQKKKNTQR